MIKTSKSSNLSLRLPKIDSKFPLKQILEDNPRKHSEVIDQREDDTQQVTKLQEWSMNKPTKKTRTMINTHNISFLYRSSAIRKQKTKQFGNNYRFMDTQLFVAKVDNELQKIGQINYFSIYKNFEYCCGVFENCFNTLLRTISKHRGTIQTELDQIQLKLQIERQEHLKKVHELQQNNNQEYRDHMNEVRQILQEKEGQIKPLRKLLQKIDATKTKVLKYCLSLGYDVREEGLIWIIKELGAIPKIEEFPSFLSPKQINFIITKYTNEYEISHAQNLMKSQICGKTINEAYQYVNRRKRRELSFIKQSEELTKLYTNRIKDYNREEHNYLNQDTLQIAQDLEKEKPKPTRYEIIYKETSKKLNKICREKIHPQIYAKCNKENKRSIKQDVKDAETVRRKQKKKSTIIIEQFSKMLNLSIRQSKKLDELYTKEEKEFQEILREIRNQKYNEGAFNRASVISKFDQNAQDDKLRNPISILGCLVGWKKAEKIIEQEMFGF